MIKGLGSEGGGGGGGDGGCWTLECRLGGKNRQRRAATSPQQPHHTDESFIPSTRSNHRRNFYVLAFGHQEKGDERENHMHIPARTVV